MPVTFDTTLYPSLQVDALFPAPIGTVDITDFVESLTTTRGRSRELDGYTGSGSLVLSNWDGRFTPGNLSGPYVSGGVSFVRPRVPIRVRATWASVTYDLFYGFASSWRDTFGREGLDPTVSVTLADPLSILAAWNGDPVAPVGEGELSGARVSRILTAAGWPLTSSVATGLSALSATTLAGNGLGQLTVVAEAEGGAYWCEGSGQFVFEGRDALITNARSNTSQVTFSPASVWYRDAQTDQPDDLLYNVATFANSAGVVRTVSDATSIGLYGQRTYPSRGTLPNIVETELQALAEFAVARYKDPEYRVTNVTIDPPKSPSLMWPQALGRRIRDRATVTLQPVRPALTITQNVFIESVAHTIRQNVWSTTFGFSSAAPFVAFTSSVFDTGVFDTATFFY